MNPEIIKSVIDILKITLTDIPGRFADRLVDASIKILETQIHEKAPETKDGTR